MKSPNKPTKTNHQQETYTEIYLRWGAFSFYLVIKLYNFLQESIKLGEKAANLHTPVSVPPTNPPPPAPVASSPKLFPNLPTLHQR